MKFKRHKFAFCMAAAIAVAVPGLTGCNNPETQAQAATATRSIGTAIDDNVITTQVKAALIADPGVKGFDFKVDTRKGEVQLSGYVDDLVQVDRAIAIAKGVEGVRDVENKVSLKNGSATIGNRIDDSIVTASVKSALLADSSVKGLQIGVATNKGVVQLSGFIDNQTQSDRATAIASATDGVRSVTNDLEIKK